MRPAKLRAKPGPEPRSGGHDQLQERQCVSRTAEKPLLCAMLISPRPRESAVEIVHLINSRNQNVALLALAVCCNRGDASWRGDD